MAPSFVVRQLGPMVAAMSRAKASLYQPPKTVISSITDDLWPNPLQPVTPIAPPRAEPLTFPLQWGQNINYTPRYDAEYSAAELRQLAMYPLARVCIENNKDMLTRMPWKVQLKPIQGETSKQRAKRGQNDKTLLALNKFFDRPNPGQDWEEFLRPILEDMLVIDAASIFLGRDAGTGKINELRWIEGASITRLVDEHGWDPLPPNPAYQQLWEGFPRQNLTMDQLVYRPRNVVPRNTVSSYLYGMSPTEQVAYEIKIGIERLKFVYYYYSEGSIPGLIQFAPVDTPITKIQEAQQWLDTNLAGQLAAKRRAQVVQGFQQNGKSEQLYEPKEPALADVFDDVHIRKICFAYGTSPQRLQRMMNRASAEMSQDSAEKEGTLPWLNWLKSLMDYIIQIKMGFDDYEFAFDPFVETDPLKQAEADKIDISIGLKTRNQVLEDRGLDPSSEPEADELSVITSSGLIPLHMAAKLATAAIRSQGSGGVGGGSGKVRTTAQGKVESSNGNGFHKASMCSKHVGYPRAYCAECLAVEEARIW